MSDSGLPGDSSSGISPENPSPIPLRQPQRQAAHVFPWGKFSQFVLGIGIGSLPLTPIFLANNLTLALVLYVTFLILAFVLIVRGETYRFVGFGMLAAILADPVIVVQACFVSISAPLGSLPPAPAPHTHSAPTISNLYRRG